MSYLVDSNVMLRILHPGSPLRLKALTAIKILLHRRATLLICSQNEVEFWGVATRKLEANGLGMKHALADRALRRFERIFTLVPDSPAVHEHWRELVITYAVTGRQVHDTRLAAVMLTHGISHILTFDVDGFRRFQDIAAVHPDEITSQNIS